jgi:hypothetical protein
MTTRSKGIARVTGLLAGCALAGAFVADGRMPESGPEPGARVTMRTGPTGELAVSRSRPFLSARNLRPGGDGDRGAVTVTNQTDSTLAVAARAVPSSRELDELLLVGIAAGGKPLFRGTLRDLRRWTPSAFTLAAGRRSRLRVRVWLPSSARRGYRARTVDVALEWRARRPGA